MEGVTILAVVKATEFTYNWWGYILGVIIMVLIGLLPFFITKEKEAISFIYFGLVVGAAFMGPSFGVVFGHEARPEAYKVTISDTVKFNEFMDKYKIISQEGEIYTVSQIMEGEE